MSFWVYCNSCFLSAGADRQLAVTTCGHVICSVCYQKGKQGNCSICSSQCQISPLSDKSSSEVKALFSDINAVTTKHLTEISKVISFQSRHQRKLLTHYKKRNEKLEETLVKMKQEMQHMTKKLNEQSAYIAKMENSFQHQSTMAPPPVSQKSRAPYPAQGHKPALQIPYNSPAPLLRQFSATSSNENTEVDEMSLFRKPNSVSRMSVNKPPQDGRMGAISSRLSSQNMLGSHSSQSPSVSRFQGAPLTPELTFNLSSKWESPIFKSSSSFRGSMSSLVSPSP
ncbi:probable E3 SUMO-protein ligase RNF212 isoform X2 [Oryzias melastigma]|uniref:Ring finger protein 212 n=1 Tax=Oryzias melastigma TaxID=30732 RepID=A0A3B3DGQ1_ORYME|nr:probable E3 SUMO-protein ligase RNF212 isoform X2 [Oryzias melastigma]